MCDEHMLQHPWHPSCKPHLIVDESYPSQRSADRRELWAGFLVLPEAVQGLSGVEADVVLLKVVFPYSTVSGIMNSVRMKMSICYVRGRPTSWFAILLKKIEIKYKERKSRYFIHPVMKAIKWILKKAISHNLIMILITLALLLILKSY